MGWLKVTVKQLYNAEPTVISTDKIVCYNVIPDKYVKRDGEWLRDCVSVATDNTRDSIGIIISCPSLDTFTEWIRRAEREGYFDATVKLDPDSIPE